MRKRKDVYEKLAEEPPVVVTGKDMIALMLATAEIIFPYIIGAAIIFYFILLFCTKVWLK